MVATSTSSPAPAEVSGAASRSSSSDWSAWVGKAVEAQWLWFTGWQKPTKPFPIEKYQLQSLKTCSKTIPWTKILGILLVGPLLLRFSPRWGYLYLVVPGWLSFQPWVFLKTIRSSATSYPHHPPWQLLIDNKMGDLNLEPNVYPAKSA